MYTLVTGDNTLILVTLKIGSAVYDCTGLTVKSRLVGKNCRSELTDTVTNTEATPGADWINGVVAVVFPGAATEDIDPVLHPEVDLETQVSDGTYSKTWFTTVSVTKGTIA